MRYLSVRRCLSAIERRALAALQPLVFEPNTPTLWFQIMQVVLGILVPIFNSGALRGDTPEQAYYVRCDETNNPPDTILNGQVLCEVGVAIAAPAEFIVFRVGRREAVVEVLE
jgi:phage tail sheath protein FI